MNFSFLAASLAGHTDVTSRTDHSSKFDEMIDHKSRLGVAWKLISIIARDCYILITIQ